MLPVQFVPKHEILTFNEEIYIIDSDKLDLFQKKMEESKFIRIGDCLIATSSIKTVRPANQEISILEKLLSGEPEEIKRKVRDKVREREKENKKNTEVAIQNIINSFK